MANPGKKQLVQELARIVRLSSTHGALMGHAVAERAGIKASHLECLDLVNLHADLTAGKMAELTGLSTGAITGIVDKLEQGGYVRRERDSTDRRKVYIRPGKGMMEIGTLYMPLATAMEKMFSAFTAEELRVLIDFHIRAADIVVAEASRIRRS